MTTQKSSEHEIKDILHHLQKISKKLDDIDERLTKLEKNPLYDGARVISEGAKAFGEGAKDIYERVEARKWFDKSYDAATKVCDSVSQQFKTWWESRNASHTESTSHDEKPKEGEVIRKHKEK